MQGENHDLSSNSFSRSLKVPRVFRFFFLLFERKRKTNGLFCLAIRVLVNGVFCEQDNKLIPSLRAAADNKVMYTVVTFLL